MGWGRPESNRPPPLSFGGTLLAPARAAAEPGLDLVDSRLELLDRPVLLLDFVQDQRGPPGMSNVRAAALPVRAGGP